MLEIKLCLATDIRIDIERGANSIPQIDSHFD